MATQYILYSKACLALDNPIDNTTLTAINTLLFHVSYYHSSNYSMKAEAIIGMTMQLACSVSGHVINDGILAHFHRLDCSMYFSYQV